MRCGDETGLWSPVRREDNGGGGPPEREGEDRAVEPRRKGG